jgi:hypothetical protein
LQGYEVINMMRKGQMQGVSKADNVRQAAFIAELFGVTIETPQHSAEAVLYNSHNPLRFLATQPLAAPIRSHSRLPPSDVPSHHRGLMSRVLIPSSLMRFLLATQPTFGAQKHLHGSTKTTILVHVACMLSKQGKPPFTFFSFTSPVCNPATKSLPQRLTYVRRK